MLKTPAFTWAVAKNYLGKMFGLGWRFPDRCEQIVFRANAPISLCDLD